MENIVKDENELLLLNEKGSFKKQESNSLRNTYFSPLAPGSLRASIFALVCVTLGSGMLPLPYFFRKNGIFFIINNIFILWILYFIYFKNFT